MPLDRHAFRAACVLLLLGGCAETTPPPASPAVAESPQPQPKPLRSARLGKPKRPDACRPATLTDERKQELFRQFTASLESGGPAPSDPAAPATCRPG